MKNDSNKTLSQLWKLARGRRPSQAGDEAAPLPLGTATRIAAAWAKKPSYSEALRRWERVTAAAFVVALLLCGTAALLRPRPATEEEDILLALFHAPVSPQQEQEPELPF